VGHGRLTSCGGRLARVDVADNDDVDVKLLLTEMMCQSKVFLMRKGKVEKRWVSSVFKRRTYPMMDLDSYIDLSWKCVLKR
jgi:hypothetical protein